MIIIYIPTDAKKINSFRFTRKAAECAASTSAALPNDKLGASLCVWLVPGTEG